jgi:5-methylcytosine-specific restriction endonuclease McrA
MNICCEKRIHGDFGHRRYLETTGKKRMQGKNGPLVTAKQLQQKLEEQNFKCALTGAILTPALSSLDHVDPRSRGGDDGIENLQIVLPVVNKAKGTMTQSQFVAMCHAVSRWNADTSDASWSKYTGHPVGG